MSSDPININTCAACGKEGGDSLKACTACHMVKYCNRDCQIAHRKQHKKACKQRAAELYDEKLFQELEPEECPICMQPTIYRDESTFKSCCGKRPCNACTYTILEQSHGKGKKTWPICAFCRTPSPKSYDEEIKRTKKLMESGNANAFNVYAQFHEDGVNGMPQDQQKAHELYLKAGELGCGSAYYNLGHSYHEGVGVVVDKKKAKRFFELAAINNEIKARYMLGAMEGNAGNYHRATKHWMIAARAGHEGSLDNVKTGFLKGIVTKDDYEVTLRGYHERHNEVKSEAREKVKRIHESLTEEEIAYASGLRSSRPE